MDGLDAFRGLRCEVECPGQPGMQRGGIRVKLKSGPHQLDGLIKAVTAEGEHHAQTGNPGIMGQMSSDGKGMQGRGQIVVHMEVDPAQGGKNGFGAEGKIRNLDIPSRPRPKVAPGSEVRLPDTRSMLHRKAQTDCRDAVRGPSRPP